MQPDKEQIVQKNSLTILSEHFMTTNY